MYHKLGCTRCTLFVSKGRWVAQSSSYTTSFRVSNKTTNLSLLPYLSFPYSCSHWLSYRFTNWQLHFLLARQNPYNKCILYQHRNQSQKSYEICIKPQVMENFRPNQLQNKKNKRLTLHSNSTINWKHWKCFVLPPFVDFTSWNLQPRLSSDSIVLLHVHHKTSLAALHLI